MMMQLALKSKEIMSYLKISKQLSPQTSVTSLPTGLHKHLENWLYSLPLLYIPFTLVYPT